MTKLQCILLVDDDPVVQFIHAELIGQMNIAERLLQASDGQSALNLLQQHFQEAGKGTNCYPQLILLDVKMPLMDGFEFMEAFEQQRWEPRPHVVLLTTSLHPLDQERARQFRFSGYLNKPLTQQSLTGVLETCFPQ